MYGRTSTASRPSGGVFDVKGSSIFVEGDNPEVLLAILAVTLSSCFRTLVAIRSGTTQLAQSFQVGQISSTPFPEEYRKFKRPFPPAACASRVRPPGVVQLAAHPPAPPSRPPAPTPRSDRARPQLASAQRRQPCAAGVVAAARGNISIACSRTGWRGIMIWCPGRAIST